MKSQHIENSIVGIGGTLLAIISPDRVAVIAGLSTAAWMLGSSAAQFMTHGIEENNHLGIYRPWKSLPSDALVPSSRSPWG